MAHVVHRTTVEYRPAVDTPRYDPAVWLISPDMAAVTQPDGSFEPWRYWKVVGEEVLLQTPAEQQATDQAIAQRLRDEARTDAADVSDNPHAIGMQNRELLGNANQRSNYNTNRLTDVQAEVQALGAALAALRDSSGTPASRLDGIDPGAGTWTPQPTQTRDREDAIKDYQDAIRRGDADQSARLQAK